MNRLRYVFCSIQAKQAIELSRKCDKIKFRFVFKKVVRENKDNNRLHL